MRRPLRRRISGGLGRSSDLHRTRSHSRNQRVLTLISISVLLPLGWSEIPASAATQPSAPRNVGWSAAVNKGTVVWSTPTTSGSSPFDRYVVTAWNADTGQRDYSVPDKTVPFGGPFWTSNTVEIGNLPVGRSYFLQSSFSTQKAPTTMGSRTTCAPTVLHKVPKPWAHSLTSAM